MIVKEVKTFRVTRDYKDISKVLDDCLKDFKDASVLAVTSKIISICENRIAPIGSTNKKSLIENEADYYLPESNNKFGVTLTIKDNILLPSAGIDESNGNGNFILWPENPQETANKIRTYLQKRFGVKKVGVIITDSKTTPLRWGTTGVCIAFCGFKPLKDYIGKKDIFGRKLEMTKANHADALAVAAVAVMGEGSEQTPLAIINDISFIKFEEGNPDNETLEQYSIAIEDDIYANLLESVKWRKGKNRL